MSEPLLTEDEHLAIRQAGELWGTLTRIVGDGALREHDLGELIHSIHHIQRYVMGQAASRAYPDLYRGLGQFLNPSPQEKP